MNVYAVKKRSVLFCNAWLITHPLDTIIFTEFNLLSIVDARQISVACNKSSKGNCANAPNVERNILSTMLTTLALTSGDPENFSSQIFSHNFALLT